MNYPRIMIAGVTSGAGKTTIAMGLTAALRRRQFKIQPFKTGPDYIDTSYHTVASGLACRNLDTWMLSKDAILELFERQASRADLSIIEGVMGLYDGLKDTEHGSSAHLAKILKTPVILVVDGRSISRSAAAIVLGYKNFDSDVNIKGVILNNIASPTHLENIKRAVETRTGIPVLGFLPKDKELTLPERHLGLVPAEEKTIRERFFGILADLIEKNINMDKLISISRSAPGLPGFNKKIFSQKIKPIGAAIAIARDKAFNFYYEDNLDILRHWGADLAEFSPLSDEKLPENTNGLYIGGGFPELFAAGLSRNTRLKRDIFDKAKKGMPIYAECGGLMYLAKEVVDFRGKRFPMAGIFDVSIKMGKGLAAMGYVNLKAGRDTVLCARASRVRAHLFHWSYIDAGKNRKNFAYEVTKGRNKIFADGLVKQNCLASYAHLHFASNGRLAKNFVEKCAEYEVKK
ncbi:MAG: cobyrinate a,c-diamide synthase [Candidatus Omnitrophica bacterium]|nr:cobyrinate a,c-diamide synthase [Candidatus Omnitrophota bacterium]